MKQLFIIGAGGLGKEVYKIIEDINQKENTYVFKGFIDSNSALKTINIGEKDYTVFDDKTFLSNYGNNDQINIAIAIGNPSAIYNVAKIYKEYSNFLFPNLIHPSVLYTKEAIKMGEGNIIAANSFISIDVFFGSFNIVNLHCTIGHDTIINNFNVINPGVNLSGGIKIGNQNLFGTNSTILQYLNIGDKNSISAASFVSKSIQNSQVLMGNPARIIALNH
jgi:sugar O-acyltransferase (sialic acid O-acetyltransferase NeuD family)